MNISLAAASSDIRLCAHLRPRCWKKTACHLQKRTTSLLKSRTVAGFSGALSDRRKYPVQAFRDFWGAAWRYAEAVKRDPLIHRAVVSAVNGLTDYLTVECKRVPEKSFGMHSVWNPCCSAATTRTSKATNHRKCDCPPPRPKGQSPMPREHRTSSACTRKDVHIYFKIQEAACRSRLARP